MFEHDIKEVIEKLMKINRGHILMIKDSESDDYCGGLHCFNSLEGECLICAYLGIYNMIKKQYGDLADLAIEMKRDSGVEIP